MDLRTVRTNKGLSLLELQKKSGFAFPYLSEIENHKKTLTHEVAVKVAGPLGVNADELQAGHLEASLKHSAGHLEEVSNLALKNVLTKDPKRAEMVAKTLAGLIDSEELDPETRTAIKKAVGKLVQALEAPAEKSKRQPDRDLYGRKREIKEVKRDAVGRAVK